MIDIDVIGQLLPNPITMLTQLCSTLVLFLVIKKFYRICNPSSMYQV